DLGVYILLMVTLGAEPGAALLHIGLIFAAAIAAFLISRAAGSSRHIARVHALAIFCVLAVVYPLNALLPAIAMIAPIALRPHAPDPREALGFVGVLALLSFVYLGVEAATGYTAINFFGLVCAGLAAARIGQLLGKALPAGAIAVALIAIWVLVLRLNPADADWHGPIAVPGGVFILAAALWPAIRPGMLFDQPAIRLALLGAAPPSLFLAVEIVRSGL
ncbi:MAG: hypothetical protein AAGL98_14930, partial [Planctomycetota bacterium]